MRISDWSSDVCSSDLFHPTLIRSRVPLMLTTGPLNDLAAIRHAFFCRTGGVSEGLFTSLNCGYGSGDEAAKVTENRRPAMAMMHLEGERLVTAYPVHSPAVVEVCQPWVCADAPKSDAMVSPQPGLALRLPPPRP